MMTATVLKFEDYKPDWHTSPDRDADGKIVPADVIILPVILIERLGAERRRAQERKCE